MARDGSSIDRLYALNESLLSWIHSADEGVYAVATVVSGDGVVGKLFRKLPTYGFTVIDSHGRVV
jgi:hypothetical protein